MSNRGFGRCHLCSDPIEGPYRMIWVDATAIGNFSGRVGTRRVRRPAHINTDCVERRQERVAAEKVRRDEEQTQRGILEVCGEDTLQEYLTEMGKARVI